MMSLFREWNLKKYVPRRPFFKVRKGPNNLKGTYSGSKIVRNREWILFCATFGKDSESTALGLLGYEEYRGMSPNHRSLPRQSLDFPSMLLCSASPSWESLPQFLAVKKNQHSNTCPTNIYIYIYICSFCKTYLSIIIFPTLSWP